MGYPKIILFYGKKWECSESMNIEGENIEGENIEGNELY